MTESFNNLIQIIHAAFDIGLPSLTLTDEECDDVVALAARQSILPILDAGMKKARITGVSKEKLSEIDKARLKDMRRYILYYDALEKISNALDETEIDYIPLKGSVLRNLYPAPYMRTSSDIDVLVKEEAVDRAVEVIETQTDFKTDHRAYHDISMLNPSVHLELHFSLKENAENIDKLLSRAWDYAEATREGSRYIFTPEYQIFYVVAHMSHHFLHGGLGIRPFLDLWMLRSKTRYDEDEVRSMCSECGILTFYEECCKLCSVWLEGAPPTETTELLEQFCLSGGVFGNHEFKTAARQREKRGARYILSRIFPPANQVREYYSNTYDEKHSMGYYYLKRLWRWAGRRSELKHQMKDIMSTDAAFLDASDRLLKLMGLFET